MEPSPTGTYVKCRLLTEVICDKEKCEELAKQISQYEGLKVTREQTDMITGGNLTFDFGDQGSVKYFNGFGSFGFLSCDNRIFLKKSGDLNPEIEKLCKEFLFEGCVCKAFPSLPGRLDTNDPQYVDSGKSH